MFGSTAVAYYVLVIFNYQTGQVQEIEFADLDNCQQAQTEMGTNFRAFRNWKRDKESGEPKSMWFGCYKRR